jgi:hypothetical protein
MRLGRHPEVVDISAYHIVDSKLTPKVLTVAVAREFVRVAPCAARRFCEVGASTA